MEPRLRSGPGIRWYLLGLWILVASVPVLGIFGLQVTDRVLARQTERELIAQSVVIAQAYREAWLRESGVSGQAASSFRPPGRANNRYVPIDPTLSLDRDLVSPEPAVAPRSEAGRTTPATRAGAVLGPLLERAQAFNLSAVRVLDELGCVVATTRGDENVCLALLPEVRAALTGRYASVARPRVSDEPPAPLSDTVRRRGDLRVFIALPVFHDNQVIGIVRASRTSADTLTTLWRNRRWLIFLAVATMLMTLGASLLFAWTVAWPLTRLTRTIQAAERSGDLPAVSLGPFAPREVAALGRALVDMSTQLRDRAEYIREFTATVSHELKSPVSAIQGAAELLADGWETMNVDQRRRFLANIEADALRMERLVSRLLELARAETAPAGTTSPAIQVRGFFDALAARHVPAVRVVFEGAPEAISIDAALLASALGNLVENALRHGAGKPVDITVACEGERLRVDVRDQGPGISAKNQERIFGRFFTTERDKGGTGLGLAIARTIARARGGDVRFTTGDDGTTFTIVL